ncbi:cupin domain-containing protein [uncultured Cohaesibacter sp.]|uniref:cupin domain-containing protein n=1 Tax=uncultured Cohaesibacter sp. TaxID=1002546 RepID=UPI0029311C43|nr:cupin domain-containing protein [uncultured Cohaesibacter sp.]
MSEQRAFEGLLQEGWKDLPFEPFREGVEVHYLWQQESGPVWAFLRYEAGASVPRHLHKGLETIIVVEGSQSDENGRYETGAVICNPEGTSHDVWSEDGCVVLIQWAEPVEILD